MAHPRALCCNRLSVFVFARNAGISAGIRPSSPEPGADQRLLELGFTVTRTSALVRQHWKPPTRPFTIIPLGDGRSDRVPLFLLDGPAAVEDGPACFVDLPDASGDRRRSAGRVSDLQDAARAGPARHGVELSRSRDR